MASIIEDKTYELITKVENFDFAFDLYSRFDSIKERLIQDFWLRLVLKFKNEYKEFNFKERPGVEQHAYMTLKSLSKVQFYIGIYDSEFQIGIAINHNGTKKKIQELEDRFNDLFEEKWNDEKGKVIWFFECKEEDFSTLFGLKKILPENRDNLIDKYLLDFKILFESKQNELTEFEENIK